MATHYRHLQVRGHSAASAYQLHLPPFPVDVLSQERLCNSDTIRLCNTGCWTRRIFGLIQPFLIHCFKVFLWKRNPKHAYSQVSCLLFWTIAAVDAWNGTSSLSLFRFQQRERAPIWTCRGRSFSAGQEYGMWPMPRAILLRDVVCCSLFVDGQLFSAPKLFHLFFCVKDSCFVRTTVMCGAFFPMLAGHTLEDMLEEEASRRAWNCLFPNQILGPS